MANRLFLRPANPSESPINPETGLELLTGGEWVSATAEWYNLIAIEAVICSDTSTGNPSSAPPRGTPASVGATAFSTRVPFTNVVTKLAAHTISGALDFVPIVAGAVAGANTFVLLTADGTHEPTFSGFSQWGGSLDWNNTAGAVNRVDFWFDGTSYRYEIGQPAPTMSAGRQNVSGLATAVVFGDSTIYNSASFFWVTHYEQSGTTVTLTAPLTGGAALSDTLAVGKIVNVTGSAALPASIKTANSIVTASSDDTVSFTVATSATIAQTPMPAGKFLKICNLGAEGLAAGFSRRSWFAHANDWLGNPVKFFLRGVFGVNGDTYGPYTGWIYGCKSQIAEWWASLPYAPSLAFFGYGINDCSRMAQGTRTLDETFEDARYCWDYALRRGALPIVLGAPPQLAGLTPPAYTKYALAWNRRCKAYFAANPSKGRFVDIFNDLVDVNSATAAARAALFDVDGIHYNARGCMVIGRIVAAALPGGPIAQSAGNGRGDVYHATDNPTGNLIPSLGAFSTTLGATTLSSTANTSTGWSISRNGSGSGTITATVAATASTNLAGETLTGNELTLAFASTTAADYVSVLLTPGNLVMSNYAAGDYLYAELEYEVSAVTGSIEMPLPNVSLYSVNQAGNRTYASRNGNASDNNEPLVQVGKRIIATPSLPVGANPNYVQLEFFIKAPAGTATIKIRNIAIRKPVADLAFY